MIELTVGIGARGKINLFLQRAKFDGEIDDFREEKHFLNSTFHVRGATELGANRIRYWQQQLSS